MTIETKNDWISIRKDGERIAKILVSEYAGKTVSKSGIRYKFNLPYIRAVNTFKLLTMEHGFIESHRNNLIVPLSVKSAAD